MSWTRLKTVKFLKETHTQTNSLPVWYLWLTIIPYNVAVPSKPTCVGPRLLVTYIFPRAHICSSHPLPVCFPNHWSHLDKFPCKDRHYELYSELQFRFTINPSHTTLPVPHPLQLHSHLASIEDCNVLVYVISIKRQPRYVATLDISPRSEDQCRYIDFWLCLSRFRYFLFL